MINPKTNHDDTAISGEKWRIDKLKRKAVSGIILTLLLTSLISPLLIIQQAKAEPGVIYIRADGSVDPATTPIQRNGDYYTFTADISEHHIVIQRDNIVVDGAGHSLKHSGESPPVYAAIEIFARKNVTIQNLCITDQYPIERGVCLDGCSGVTVTHNTITKSETGIAVGGGSGNTLSYNTIIDGTGIDIRYSRGNIIFGNTLAYNYESILIAHSSSDNMIFHNNILSNAIPEGLESANIWDNGYPSGGNYWGFTSNVDERSGPYQTQPGSDGIIDTPMFIWGIDNVDKYPLMKPWPLAPPIPDFSFEATPNSLVITQGSSETLAVTIKSLNGFNQMVHYELDFGTGYELVFFNPNPLEVTPPPDGSTTTYITADVASNVAPGAYTVIVRGRAFPFANVDPDKRTSVHVEIVAQHPPKFKIGDRVRAAASLNVRAGPGLSYGKLGTIPTGALGQILGGPVAADGYIWWNVNYYVGIRGWSAENWLEIAPSAPDDAYWLAKAIMSEASVGTQEEKVAVGWTVLNRLDSGRFGSSIERIVKGGYAYNQEPTSQITELANDLLDRSIQDVTGGATYFFSPRGMPRQSEDTTGFDVGGGLQQVPLDGQDIKVHFPSFAKPRKGTTVTEITIRYLVAEPYYLEWRNLVGVRNWYFMFYRPYTLRIQAEMKSPCELRVYDSQGRVTGSVNGTQVIEIPESDYSENSVTMFFPNDTYRFVSVGRTEGSYGLSLTAITKEENITFSASDIPTSAEEIHQYTVDFLVLFSGGEGVTMQVDFSGDGVFEKTVTADAELTHDEFILQTATTVDFDPSTLNLNSKGKWIIAYIQLPEGYNAADINATTILLDGTFSPVLDPKYSFVTNSSEYLIDHNNDGILERMVKFNRADLESYIYHTQGIRYGNVALTITGELLDGTEFEATDTVFVNYAGDANNDGIINLLDMGVVSAHWGTSDCNADCNRDGIVNLLDMGIISANWGQTTP